MFEIMLSSGLVNPVIPEVIPGATELTSGNLTAGYYSTVVANDLITPAAFCSLVGLNGYGTLINDNSPWVKMSYRSRTIFYSKQCIRSNISWANLSALGIHDGTKVIRILGHNYRCRIMKASTVDPYTQGNISNPSQMQGSEYADMILRMCSTVTSVDGGAKLGSFTESELGLMTGLDMVTNTSAGATGGKMAVGGNGSITKVVSPNNGDSGYGYRAVLELIETPPTVDSGPGPTTMLKYEPEDKSGYYGQVAFADFFTIEQIEAIAAVALPGTAVNRTATNYWLKTYHNGKVLFLLRYVVRTGTTWANIYNAGFQYGVDGNGRAPTATPTNQLRVLTKTMPDGTIYRFKVRAIQAYGVDPYPASLVASQTASSEYALLRERLTPSTGVPIAWDSLGSISGQTFGVEKNAAGTQSLMLNNNSAYLNRTAFDNTDTRFCNFYPVLELIEVIKP